ncbi:MAG TPA: hypothetical protein VIP70_03935 [Nitrososphaeraceae archaeon]
MFDSENTVPTEDFNDSKNVPVPLRIGEEKDSLIIDPCGISSSASITSDQIKIDTITIQTLEGYVLPLLPSAPLHIHNIHLKCITATNTNNSNICYHDLKLPSYKQNTGKYQLLNIDNIKVSYVFYPNRTIDIYTKNSDNPFKLQTEADCISLLNFFRKIKANLPAQVLVAPDIYEWEFTECDINRDIKVSNVLHFAGVKVQVKHMDHLFRVYIKKIGEENTFCRVEETKHLKKPVIEAIHDIFNLYERIEKQIAEIRRMLNPRSR